MVSTDTAVDSDDDFQPPHLKRKKPKGGLSALKSEWMSTKRHCVLRTIKSTLVGLSITSMLGSMTITNAIQRNLATLPWWFDSTSDVASWLEKYVLSTRKKTGEPYLPKTVYLLLCGLQRYMKEEKVCAMNIFDRNDPDFKRLYCTCDNYFRELRADGVGSHAEPPNWSSDSSRRRKAVANGGSLCWDS